MKLREIESEILSLKQIIQQTEYTARKVAFEVAKIVKQLHPEIDMPSLDQYLELDNQIQSFRDRINELQTMIDNGEYEELDEEIE